MDPSVQSSPSALIHLATITLAAEEMKISFTTMIHWGMPCFLLHSLLPLVQGRRFHHFFLMSKSHPADLYLPHWRHGKSSALDVTVIYLLQKLTLHGAATTQGHALDVVEEKETSFPFQCLSLYWNFLCSSGGGVLWRMELWSCWDHQNHQSPSRAAFGTTNLRNHAFPTSSKRLSFTCGEETLVCGPHKSLLTCPWLMEFYDFSCCYCCYKNY